MKISYILYPLIGLFLLIGCSKDKQTEGTGSGRDTSYVPPTAPTGTGLNTTHSDSIIKNYKLVWADEFEGKELDKKKWNYRYLGSVRDLGTVSANTISLDGNGHLAISVMKDQNGKYLIGQIGTQNLFETTYGYFECRAQMNKSLGPHVAFWLQAPTMGNTDDNPAVNGTEIDIFEYHRKTPSEVYHNIHWNGYGPEHRAVGVKEKIPNIDTGFHTFGVLWTEYSYIFYVDGNPVWKTISAVSQRSEYMILSAELTGWGGDPNQGSFPDSVVFDYVRVYKPK